MLVGAFFGLGLEKYLPKRFQVGLGAIIGAGIGNAFSDFMGGVASLNWPLAFGTGLAVYCFNPNSYIHKTQKYLNK